MKEMKTEVTSVTTRPHPISNTFHLIMTICTGGLWIPVWIFMARGHKVTTRSPVAAAQDNGPEPEIGWGTQLMQDRVAAGDSKAQARRAFLDEIKRRNAG
jgi:hypothetical protein